MAPRRALFAGLRLAGRACLSASMAIAATAMLSACDGARGPSESATLAPPATSLSVPGASGAAPLASQAPASAGAGPTSATATLPAAAPPRGAAPLRLSFVGDVAFNYSVGKDLEALESGTAPREVERDFPFAGVAERLSAADLAIGNLECVVSTKGKVATWHKPFRAPLAAVGALQRSGLDLVSVANNHAWDFGGEAFFDMLQILDAAKVGVFGRGYRQELPHEPEKVVIREVRGTRVGVLGFYLAHDADIARDVAAASTEVDLLVVYFHWGKEKQSDVTPEQRRQARIAVDAGADLVAGTHVHVLQPVEMYREKLIAYGLGNFVFMGMNHEERFRRGAILEVALSGDRLSSFELVPTRVDDRGAPRLVVAESSYLPDSAPGPKRARPGSP